MKSLIVYFSKTGNVGNINSANVGEPGCSAGPGVIARYSNAASSNGAWIGVIHVSAPPSAAAATNG